MTAMIARATDANASIWSDLSAPLPPSTIQWRQDGRPVSRDGRHIARFVGYIDAHFVHDRFDSVVPGEWDSTLELLPPAVTTEGEEVEPFAFKCRIQVLGVIREDVGTGKDYKSAASDAFKRAAVRFGIGKELYSLGQNWVQMDGDGKYAKPLEDPAVVYAKKATRPRTAMVRPVTDGQEGYGDVPERERGEMASGRDDIGSSARAIDSPECPKCGKGNLYDNRAENDARAARGEKLRPDWKCRDRACDGVLWRPKPGPSDRVKPGRESEGGPLHRELEEIPF
jgi:hypothetical protein